MPADHAKHDPVRLLLAQGKTDQALARAQRAFQSSPRDAGAAKVLSEVLLAAAQLDRAVHFARTAAGLAPDDLACVLHHVSVLSAADKPAEALALLERAAPRFPREPALHAARIDIELELNRCVRAERTCREALLANPGDTRLRTKLAAALLNVGRVEEAVQAMRTAAAGEPANLAFAGGLAYLMNYSPGESPEAVLAQHRRYGELLEAAHGRPKRVFTNTRDPDRRLRIGIVSPDLRAHSVAWFIEPFLEHHDRERIELVVYQTNYVADEVTARLRRHCETWRIMDTVSDAQLAEAIFADHVDVLIELSGHTHLHSLAAMQARPAPVQVTYLGYPNVTGVREIDARIGDSITDPPGPIDACGCERLLRLDPCFLCYRPPPAPEPSPTPAAAGRGITFGSFNTVQKMSGRLVTAWARVLRAVPGSRLLLKGVAFTDADLREDVRLRFIDAGVEADRIEVLPKAESLADHLCLYSRVDIALDPFPYNGTTTTCEALYMGVPVLTVAGALHAGRVGASLLSAIGLPELIARDEDDYVNRAVSLAADLPRLTALRASMRPRLLNSPLCDGPNYAGRMETLLRNEWRDWCLSRA